MEHGQPQDRAAVIGKLRGHMLNMARHKFASNVCEKALVTADPETRRLLIEEVMTPKQDGPNPIIIMMKDQFASMFLLGCGRRYHTHAFIRLCVAACPVGGRRRTEGGVDEQGSQPAGEYASD